jgi:trk system potassium uptake protein TrkA
MDLTNMMTIMKLNDGNYSIVQIGIDAKSPAISKAVKDLAIPQNALLITISRGQETIVPNGDTVIRVGDSIVALTNEENRTRLYKLFGQVARG